MSGNLVTIDYIVYYLVHLLNHVALRSNVKIFR